MEPISAEDPAWIGPYRLLGLLGEGGMGRVYLARSEGGRTVAVKLILRQLAQDGEFRQRFAQEVSAARRVGGRWTAPVLDADTGAAVPWVATGYIPGPSLSEVVGKDHGPLPETSVRALASGLSQALEAIHSVGLVHRDLKPSNILVTVDGPRVIDFGIARALDAQSASGDVRTRTGAVVGSPGFMSPEQVLGQGITPASDVFCLGAVLAYAATGRTPFGGAESGVHSLLYRIVQEEPDLEGVPPRLAGLVRACLMKDPAGRPSVAELIEATRDSEPAGAWLPGALLAELGQRAARLLDAELPAPAHAPVPQQRPQPQPVGLPYGPTAFQTPPPVPQPHHGYPYAQPTHPTGPYPPAPAPPAARSGNGGKITAIVLSIVVGLPVMLVLLLMLIGWLAGDDKETPEIREIEGAVPDAYLGAWEGSVAAGPDGEFQGRFDIVQGEKREMVATVTYTLPYAVCQSRAPLVSAEDKKIVLGAGSRTNSVPADAAACAEPSPEQTFTVQPDGTLRWESRGVSTTLRPAETSRAPVHPKFLGTWELATRPAADGLRLTIAQNTIGKEVVTATGAGSAKGCRWKGVLAGAHTDRLVLGPLVPATSGCPVRGSMVLTPAGEGRLYTDRTDRPKDVRREELNRVTP
ncbi:serine/threonine-protein kinase [Streptomyces ficellus]|uniref:Serine/threonine protein kinase n=1 Tax=Streptomyces ficellus TaxID=1977088 RepID=A0A6I6F5N3_9ACTN|nr:serine/threonine-protein kinase [Streptomyces ficellus]QGV78231.1 serine/threonine protein kinase [Streptomyces ficellus]